MAFITLAGTLRDPTSELAVGDQIRFTHKSTTGETVEGAVSILTIDPSGTYSKDLQYGLVLVEYKDVRTSQFKNLGVATVNGSNPATSIPELLNALVPVSSAELIEFQAILADAVTARNEAEAFAASIDLINDLSQAYIFDTVALMKSSVKVFPLKKILITSNYRGGVVGGGATYIVSVSAVVDGYGDHSLNDSKVAMLKPVNNTISFEQYGISTSISSNHLNMNACLIASVGKKSKVIWGDGDFKTSAAVVMPDGTSLTGSGYAQDEGTARTKLKPQGDHDGLVQGFNCLADNFNIEGPSTGSGEGLYIPDGRTVFKNIGCHLMGGNGFRIGSKASGDNANLFRGVNLYAKLNEAAGMYIHHDSANPTQPDVNAGQINGLDARRNKGDGLRMGQSQDNEMLNIVTQTNDGVGINLLVNADAHFFTKPYTESNVGGEASVAGNLNILYGSRSGAGTTEWIDTGVANQIIGRNTAFTGGPYYESTPKYLSSLFITDPVISGNWNMIQNPLNRNLEISIAGTGSYAKVVLPALAISPDGNGDIKKFVKSGFTVAVGTLAANTTIDVVLNVPKGVAGDFISVMPNVAVAVGITWSARMSAATQATVRISNITSSSVVVGSPTFDYHLWG